MTTTAPGAVTRRSARRVAAAGAIGSIIEWYDYSLYGAASALVITPLFFPNLNAVTGQLAAFATFGVGFVVRPLGGIIFGGIGDRFGRKSTLLFTVLMMGAVSALMGLLPSYSAIGVAAPVLLVVLRLIQGLGAGAEFAGALTYVAESADSGRRAFRTSFTGSASIAGIFIATGVFAIMSATTSHAQFLGWGWRIPFLFSLVLVVPAVIIRARLADSPEFAQLKDRGEEATLRARIPLLDMFKNDARSFASAALAPTILSVVGYLITTFSVSYVVNTLKLPSTMTLTVTLAATGVGMVCAPLFGLLADRIGSTRVFLFGAVFGLLFAFPYFVLLNTKNVTLILLAATVNYGVTWGATAGAQGDFLPALFRTRYRFTGVATAREVNTAVFAGPAPLVAGALVAASGGRPWLVAAFVVVMGALSIIGIVLGRPAVEARPRVPARDTAHA
jgi:MHS family shikimate/dehydroshikimate transporter-like MFS transporter